MLILLLACAPNRSLTCPAGGCADADAQDTQPQDTAQTGWAEHEVAMLLGKRGFTTIQEAITQADDGDVVLVRAGVHNERLDFHGKGIHVVSESGPWLTVLDATGLHGSVVEIRAMEPATAILEGFTITGGVGTEGHGGGIFIENADPIIQHNIVVGNTASIAGGVYMRHGSATIRNNLILDNLADQGGGGVVCTNCKGRIEYNTIVGNRSTNGSVGEWFFEPQGDLVGNILVAEAQDGYLIRFMEPLGYTFECSYNLVWPELPWVSEQSPPGWPDCAETVYGAPQFVETQFVETQFVDTERFELGPQSPGVDSGPAGETDPDGSPADRGAYGGAFGDWTPKFSVDG